MLLPSLGGSEMGVMLPWLALPGLPAPGVLVLTTPCPLPDAPLPTSLCPRSPPLSLSRALPRGPQHLRQPPSPFSPHLPTSLPASGSRCWRQEQGNIVQGCHAQVLGFPPSPHPPPCWGSGLGVSRLFTDIAIFCITFPSFLLPFQSSKAFEVQL